MRYGLTVGAGVVLLAGFLGAGPAIAAEQPPVPRTGVVKPPPHVDPGMQVKPRPQAASPMPVVKPPANVVPK